MALALVLIDALSSTYVDAKYLPVLYDFALAGVSGSLQNIYGFRGIEATLFTGKWPSEHGVWGEFHPAQEPHFTFKDRLVNSVISTWDFLPSDRLRLDIRYVMSKLRHGNSQTLPTGNLIPPNLLPYFNKSIEKYIWEKNSLGQTLTLFDKIRNEEKFFATVLYPIVQNDKQILSKVKELVTKSLPDFWYIKYSALDQPGHVYGPDPNKIAPILYDLDQSLSSVVHELKRAYSKKGIDFIILSDHGMSRVTSYYDPNDAIERIKILPGETLLYFLDSTTLRFWTNSPRILIQIEESFSNVPGLKILTAIDRQNFKLPNDENIGNIIITLDEGKVVFPDFFRRRIFPLGMHGYALVNSIEGLPYFAAESGIAKFFPDGQSLNHIDIWNAMNNYFELNIE